MIDAHQHFWKFDPVRDAWIDDRMEVIRRDFLPHDLKPLLDQHNIEGCVAVQADQSESETNFLLSLTETNDFIKGVVGWIDLRSAQLSERLTYFSAFKKLKGFRHIVQAEPDGFLLDNSFVRGVTLLSSFGYTYDLLIYPHQLEEALVFVRKVPAVKIVIDHLAKPVIRKGEWKDWSSKIKNFANEQQVYCKVSGMVTEANWEHWQETDFYPYLDTVFNVFGSARILYGSDWPVCLLAGSYANQFSVLHHYLHKLSAAEKHQVMDVNARKFYNL